MAKILFLGGEDTGNVGSVQWGRFTFELNKWVDCDDPHIVAKACGNRFFKVDGGGGQVQAEIVPDEPDPEPVVKIDPLAKARAAKAAKRAAEQGDAA